MEEKSICLPEWISVKERLPDKEGYYLVYWEWISTDGTYYSDGIDIIYFRGKSRWAKTSREKDITYWMPLPERPKSILR